MWQRPSQIILKYWNSCGDDNQKSPLSTLHSPLAYSFGLIGYPLGHSLSPQIHGAALHALGISGEYGLYLIPPLPEGEDELAVLLTRVRTGEIHGLNVTIPHKQNVIPLLDELTPAAQTIGAVNTIFLREGILIGDNTDAPGFWGDVGKLVERGVESGELYLSALVLGSGGGARAWSFMPCSPTDTMSPSAPAVKTRPRQKPCGMIYPWSATISRSSAWKRITRP